ncbi:hypothetical protein Nos7107_1236 [Nostoc sp. PCC 7107]|nr:hypothetical protein Nos7107_1236 [Nostoc sp. PCC 7107]
MEKFYIKKLFFLNFLKLTTWQDAKFNIQKAFKRTLAHVYFKSSISLHRVLI